jgi:DNA-binding LytR/AlgR family response regulator
MKAVIGMNLRATQELLARQTSENMPTFMRIGKRYIVNTNFICQIHITKQKFVLSDFEHFSFTLTASKEALKTMREMYTKSFNIIHKKGNSDNGQS